MAVAADAVRAPGATPPAPSRPAPPQGATPPAGAIPLQPNESGRVFIETKSGQTRCQIDSDSVGCEAEFTNSPMQDDEHTKGVDVTASGDVK